MGIVSSIIECLAAFFAGFFGHVVAHDFCEVTPMISRKLIDFSASQLPSSLRDRYVDEWTADLHDQPGSLAKLKWALGCLWSARRMARQAESDRLRLISLEFVWANGEKVACDAATALFVASTCRLVGYLSHPLLRRLPKKFIGSVLMAALVIPTVLRARRYGPPNYKAARRMIVSLADRALWPQSMTRVVAGVAQQAVDFQAEVRKAIEQDTWGG